MNIRKFGWTLIFVASLMTIAETKHFGWNFTAKSDTEMVCDLICCIPLAFGLACLGGTKEK